MLKPSRALLRPSTSSRSAKLRPTHFTSTGPHASSPLSADAAAARASTVEIKSGGHKGETPRQRVERLRAAARAAKLAELPWQERWIDRGRFITDKIHRSFVIFLVGASVLIGGYTIYALGDMFMYNRKKRSEWLKEKQKRNEEALYTAIKAVNEGSANLKQRVLVRRYETVKNAEEERIQNRGAIAKMLDWVLPGIQGKQSEAKLVMKLDADIVQLLQSGEINRFLDEKELSNSANSDLVPHTLAGGLLDQKAQRAADAVQAATSGWRSSFWWR